ncbi:hypothetical protein KO317_02340 [Candidatus Micrarchaeota archaeon]|nr:hypothetical protein [Candidatus Micrarchaeota archaeon]
MKEITVITKNEIGALAEVCSILGKAGINLQGISANGVDNKGIIKIITSDPISSENFLNKKGYKTKINDVIVAKINDRPGELSKLIEKLSRERVNLESVYLLNNTKGIVEIAIIPERTEDIEKITDMIGKGYIA